MGEQKNLFLAIVLSMAVIFAFQFFFTDQNAVRQAQQEQQAAQTGGEISTGGSIVPAAPGTEPGAPDSTVPMSKSRNEILAEGPRLKIETANINGSVALTGGRIDDIVLLDYRETVKPDSPNIVLFAPPGSAKPYYAEYGWVPGANGAAAPKLPSRDTVWTASADTLTPETPVTLSWDNGEGLRFERELSFAGQYMLNVTQRIVNTGTESVTVSPYALISRADTPETLGFYILHEGPLGVLNDTLTEIDYDDIVEEQLIKEQSTGGWVGITDKYWLSALIPDQSAPFTADFVHRVLEGRDRFQVDFVRDTATLEPGGSYEVKSHLFAGAKRVDLIDHYQDTLGIQKFDLSIDWGWFYFLTRPIYYVLHEIYKYVGNYGVAIILLTILLKIILFPLANKSYKSMAKMKKLQPKMLELRERYGDDKQRLQKEMMELYKREKANPASGCLPILVQIPIFFALYKVLFVTIEMRQAPFFGWIQDLSVPDPTTLFNLYGLIPWTPPEWLIPIGIWPTLMGISMFLQQKLNPQPPDPTQAKIMMMLPFVFTFLLASFPAGLVIYWTVNNVLSIAQQWVIMRSHGVEAPAKT